MSVQDAGPVLSTVRGHSGSVGRALELCFLSLSGPWQMAVCSSVPMSCLLAVQGVWHEGAATYTWHRTHSLSEAPHGLR